MGPGLSSELHGFESGFLSMLTLQLVQQTDPHLIDYYSTAILSLNAFHIICLPKGRDSDSVCFQLYSAYSSIISKIFHC